jgi:hypothetical protein
MEERPGHEKCKRLETTFDILYLSYAVGHDFEIPSVDILRCFYFL